MDKKEQEIIKRLIEAKNEANKIGAVNFADGLNRAITIVQTLYSEPLKNERAKCLGKLRELPPFSDIDIPDCVFQSAEAKACGFTKRSFLEAGWRKITAQAETELAASPVQLSESEHKDIIKAGNDLKAHKMPDIFSFRHAYFIGAEAQFNAITKET
jgi:hypothetical protein